LSEMPGASYDLEVVTGPAGISARSLHCGGKRIRRKNTKTQRTSRVRTARSTDTRSLSPAII
jgi:hypothetical protein